MSSLARATTGAVAPPASTELVELSSSVVNARLWEGRNRVAEYAHRRLRPVEVVLLARYQAALAGRVLEAGCGAGRMLGYLVALSEEVHGIDLSPAMVDYCKRAYPEAHVALGNMLTMTDSVDGPFDAVLAPDNVLDVFDGPGRRRALIEVRELLGPDGTFIFSSHNLAYMDGDREATGERTAGEQTRRWLRTLVVTSPAHAARGLIRLPRRMRNRRRLSSLEQRAEDHAILNDSEGDYGALHYYVRRDVQERQLREAGFALVECLDAEGRPVAAGAAGYGPWLHYVARPVSFLEQVPDTHLGLEALIA